MKYLSFPLLKKNVCIRTQLEIIAAVSGGGGKWERGGLQEPGGVELIQGL